MSDRMLIAPLRGVAQPCPYLPGHCACYEHFLLLEGDEEAVSRLIESGFRHFGHYYFRPACTGLPGSAWCGACLPLRVKVGEFSPSKTQRRVLRRGQAITHHVGAPCYWREKYEIYMRHRRRFPQTESGPHEAEESFRDSFYNTGPTVREVVYRLDDKIIAVSFLDVAPRLVSSIYCAFDPDCESWSPGTLSILREIEIARTLGVPYYYLGYWVHANRSLQYKADFRPCEIFDGTQWVQLRDAGGAMKLDSAQLRTGRYAPLLGEPSFSAEPPPGAP